MATGAWANARVRDLPDLPKSTWSIIGPGIVAAGVGLSSGEFILWPFIASQVGLVFLWAAVVGVVTQFFLNMEVERYTLATGETAITGFNRLWRHWGLVVAIMVYFANLWPGWALSSATIATYLFGGDARTIATIMLVVIGASLTLAPVVYVALERLIFLKVAAVVTLAILAAWLAIDEPSWRALPAGLVNVGYFPPELSFALLFGAMVFAGAGGGQNLCQSNWIRDKGFGMGKYVPRLVSPLTGSEQAAETGVLYRFEPTAGEHGALAPVVAIRQHRAGRELRPRDGPDHRAHVDARARDAVRPAIVAERSRLSRDRRQRAGLERRQLVQGAVLGDRSVLAVRLRDGHHRLHEPPCRGHSQVDVPDASEVLREPAVLRARLGSRGHRLDDRARRRRRSPSCCSSSPRRWAG